MDKPAGDRRRGGCLGPPQTTEMCGVVILTTRSPRSSCRPGCFLLRATREALFQAWPLLLAVSGAPRVIDGTVCLFTSPACQPCLSSNVPFKGHSPVGSGPTHMASTRSSAKTPFPNNVTCTSTGGEDFNIVCGWGALFTFVEHLLCAGRPCSTSWTVLPWAGLAASSSQGFCHSGRARPQVCTRCR